MTKLFQVIDDEDIGCDLPTVMHPRSTSNPETIRYFVRSCQVSSRICKRLMSAERLVDQPAKILNIVIEMDRQLCLWKDSLPPQMQPSGSLRPSQASHSARTLEWILLHCSFYDLVMVLHAPYAYPWITQRFRIDANIEFGAKIEAQVAQSSKIMAEAARNIIIMTRNFEINGANTHAYVSTIR